MRRLIMLILAATGVITGAHAQDPATEPKITRAIATLNGVFSNRGFFNITVRLYQLQGLEWAKFDLKQSRMTLDFKPGVTTTKKEIQDVMVSAGYKPGAVTIESLATSDVSETGPGWVKIKHPKSKNPIIRWFELNF
jgi:hypothetical protein